MSTVLGRIQRLRQVFARHSIDPGLQGRAMLVAGTALIADGLVGLDNPLSRSSKRRPGIFGALAAMGIGVAVIYVAQSISADTAPYPRGDIAEGTVVRVVASDDRPSAQDQAGSCSAAVRYPVRDETFEVAVPGTSSAVCDMEGTTVAVSYRPEDPSAGRPQLEQTELTLRVLPWLGWLLLGVGTLTALVRLAAIVIGIVLLVRGRRLTRANPPVSSEAVLSELQAAWAGRSPT